MKYIALYLFISFQCLAQIPNSSFEQWEAYAPDGWDFATLPGCPNCFGEKTSISHEAQNGIKMKMAYVTSSQFVGSVLKTYSNSTQYVSYSQKPNTLSFWLKFHNNNVDSMDAGVELRNNGVKIGSGWLIVFATDTFYHKYSIPISYSSSAQPQEIKVTFSSLTRKNYKTYYILDELSTDADVGVNEYLSANGIKVYYNQEFNEIHIKKLNEFIEINSIELYELSGRIIHTAKCSDRIRLSSTYEHGIYLVKFIFKDGSVGVIKLIM
jgi:hypothetical protein